LKLTKLLTQLKMQFQVKRYDQNQIEQNHQMQNIF